MELSEQGVEVDNGSGVVDEGVPVAANFTGSVKLLDDFLEVPWEGKYVCVLLLVELLISTDSLVKWHIAHFSSGLLLSCCNRSSFTEHSFV